MQARQEPNDRRNAPEALLPSAQRRIGTRLMISMRCLMMSTDVINDPSTTPKLSHIQSITTAPVS